MTPGLFLLGLYAGRKRFFEEIPTHMRIIKKYLQNASWALLGTVLGGVLFFVVANSITGGLSDDANMLAGLTIFDFFNTFLAVIYVTGFMLLFQKEKWNTRLMRFYDAGRMGLTTYLMQAFFGVLIFSTIRTWIGGRGGRCHFGFNRGSNFHYSNTIQQILVEAFLLRSRRMAVEKPHEF